MIKRGGGLNVVLGLTIAAFCLLGKALHQSGIFHEFEAALLPFQWMLLICFIVWCGTFLILKFSLKDLPLIGLLLIATILYFISYKEGFLAISAMVLLASVMLGKGARFVLRQNEEGKMQKSILEFKMFLIGLVFLLGFSSWWHLNTSEIFSAGMRWAGLWDNPNIYGMLMASGVTLAIGLLSGRKNEEGRRKKWISVILFIAAFMMGIGLVMSCSRGAWLAVAIGLLYLTWRYGKLKWRYVLPGIVLVVGAVLFFWSRTPDSARWYVKRMDFGRPSAQHRVVAWKAGFKMMRNHPFGIGWSKTVETYEKNYSPPENGAAAITTNDYLMMGTQLGIPALLCFVSYAVLCLRGKPKMETEVGKIQTACRAGAVVFLVAFWFDGGLFKLATAAVFWILLELGSPDRGVDRWKAKAIKEGSMSSGPSQNSRGKTGFTLVEMLTVIVVIGILAALLLPVLSGAKKSAQGVYCMNNSRQLALAIQLYTQEYHEFYPPNPDDGNTMDGYNWCAGDVSGGIGGIPPGPQTFNPDALSNPNKSLVTPFLKNTKVFQCPADPRYGLYNGNDPSLAGQQVHAARSVSMNQGVGTIDAAFDADPAPDNHEGPPVLSVNGPWLNGLDSHRRNSPYATFGKTTDFAAVSPSQIFLTLDESPWSINDAAFGVSAAIAEWVDWPSTFHNNGCGLSFCDDHAEIHRWQTGSLNLDRKAPKKQPIAVDNPDWHWLADHATVKLH